MQKAYLEVQEELIAELSSERNRQRMVLAEQERSRLKKLAAANGTTATATAATTAGGRSLRSSAPAGSEGLAENGTSSGNAYGREYPYSRSGGAGGTNGAAGAGGAAGSSSGNGGTRKRTAASAPSLDFLLPENSMR